ncbi:DNA-binding response regulator [Rivihabitans pingtungensis]|uniref:ActR/RegA family two-component response regulator n=1 Tax=Rivihabitans pingtungensis TaxID=1054498 RepID=A0A318L123_9NEIS|nr:DNA-binding response regulator [Rivihabitans pingtungensis]PXX79233.1 ActR/RegA family two-component response regulator [Rivihabitans pingtungensis]
MNTPTHMVSPPCRVLLLDKSPWGARMRDSLLAAGAQVEKVNDVTGALNACRRVNFTACIIDFVLDGHTAQDTIAAIHQLQPGARIIAVSNHAQVSHASAALHAGAYDYLPKPAPPALVLHALGLNAHTVSSGAQLTLASMKKMLIEDILLESGSISAAARALGIERSSFRRMVSRYVGTTASTSKKTC